MSYFLRNALHKITEIRCMLHEWYQLRSSDKAINSYFRTFGRLPWEDGTIPPPPYTPSETQLKRWRTP